MSAAGGLLITEAGGVISRFDGSPIALGYHTGHWEVGLLMEEAARTFAVGGDYLRTFGVDVVRGRQPPVCREMVRTLLHGHRYDGSRAARELGLEYTPVAETFRRTIEWAASEGLVSRQAG